MITVYPVLGKLMVRNGITIKKLSEITNTNKVALALKMLGIKRWKLHEAVRICCFFHTQDAERLFQKGRVRSVRGVRKYYNIHSNRSQ